MRVFLGGQIMEHCRGGYAAILGRGDGTYEAFLYPMDAGEFFNLTGPRSICQVERVYAGVSHSSGEEIVKAARERGTGYPLRGIDALVVESRCLDEGETRTWEHFVHARDQF